MGKIYNRTDLSAAAERWRVDGKIVVFTNGCFDIVHRGHVEYLAKTKNLGDVLVLGLNSDQSVKKLKGSGRPYVPQGDRAYILSQLISVDAVCIFEEETPLKLIKSVKPDVLVKGGDYSLDKIVGKEEVEKTGELLLLFHS